MAQRRSRSGEILGVLQPLLIEFLPVLVDRFAEIYQKPGLQEVKQDQVRLERRVDRLLRRLSRLYLALGVLIAWNAALTIAIWLLLNR